MEVKRELLGKCMEQLEGMVRDFRQEIDESQQAANEYGAPKDRYDAYRTQLLRKRDMFARQLTKVTMQVDVLKQINVEKVCEVVEFGALVITSDQKLFVAAGLGKMEVEGVVYYAISPGVPICKAMNGKRAGEEFVFNGRKIKIIEVQ